MPAAVGFRRIQHIQGANERREATIHGAGIERNLLCARARGFRHAVRRETALHCGRERRGRDDRNCRRVQRRPHRAGKLPRAFRAACQRSANRDRRQRSGRCARRGRGSVSGSGRVGSDRSKRNDQFLSERRQPGGRSAVLLGASRGGRRSSRHHQPQLQPVRKYAGRPGQSDF